MEKAKLEELYTWTHKYFIYGNFNVPLPINQPVDQAYGLICTLRGHGLYVIVRQTTNSGVSHYWFAVVVWVLFSVFSIFFVFLHLVIAHVWPQHQDTNTNSKAQSRKKKNLLYPSLGIQVSNVSDSRWWNKSVSNKTFEFVIIFCSEAWNLCQSRRTIFSVLVVFSFLILL